MACFNPRKKGLVRFGFFGKDGSNCMELVIDDVKCLH
jgi:hypothetical protein